MAESPSGTFIACHTPDHHIHKAPEKHHSYIMAVEQQGHSFLSRFIRPPSVYYSRIVPVGDISVGDGLMVPWR